MKKTKQKSVLAWHIIRDDKHLQYDKTKIIVEPGLKLKVDPKNLGLCNYGLHASKRLIDALKYAPGSKICRVRLSGKIISGDDKLVAQKREVLYIVDAERALNEFACWTASKALKDEEKRGRIPDPRSFAAIEAKHKYLNGEIDSNTLGAAESAAWSAAESAAWSAAESAARSAAWSAARSAAESAAESAAWSAAESAAWSAAESAQNKKLTSMILRLPKIKR